MRIIMMGLSLCLLLGCTVHPTSETTFINPLNGYSQVVSVHDGRITTLYISGQVGTGPNFETQMKMALSGVEEQLAAVGGTLKDLVKMNTYIVDYVPAHLDTFRQVRADFMGNVNMPASTLVGVQALGLPEWRVEIDGVAILKD
ncbi:MAG: RidA family protein [Saprospiraceae bacterium]|nr:RidA family protein [Saprospiraceae bacterium]